MSQAESSSGQGHSRPTPSSSATPSPKRPRIERQRQPTIPESDELPGSNAPDLAAALRDWQQAVHAREHLRTTLDNRAAFKDQAKVYLESLGPLVLEAATERTQAAKAVSDFVQQANSAINPAFDKVKQELQAFGPHNAAYRSVVPRWVEADRANKAAAQVAQEKEALFTAATSSGGDSAVAFQELTDANLAEASATAALEKVRAEANTTCKDVHRSSVALRTAYDNWETISSGTRPAGQAVNDALAAASAKLAQSQQALSGAERAKQQADTLWEAALVSWQQAVERAKEKERAYRAALGHTPPAAASVAQLPTPAVLGSPFVLRPSPLPVLSSTPGMAAAQSDSDQLSAPGPSRSAVGTQPPQPASAPGHGHGQDWGNTSVAGESTASPQPSATLSSSSRHNARSKGKQRAALDKDPEADEFQFAVPALPTARLPPPGHPGAPAPASTATQQQGYAVWPGADQPTSRWFPRHAVTGPLAPTAGSSSGNVAAAPAAGPSRLPWLPGRAPQPPAAYASAGQVAEYGTDYPSPFGPSQPTASTSGAAPAHGPFHPGQSQPQHRPAGKTPKPQHTGTRRHGPQRLPPRPPNEFELDNMREWHGLSPTAGPSDATPTARPSDATPTANPDAAETYGYAAPPRVPSAAETAAIVARHGTYPVRTRTPPPEAELVGRISPGVGIAQLPAPPVPTAAIPNRQRDASRAELSSTTPAADDVPPRSLARSPTLPRAPAQGDGPAVPFPEVEASAPTPGSSPPAVPGEAESSAPRRAQAGFINPALLREPAATPAAHAPVVAGFPGPAALLESAGGAANAADDPVPQGPAALLESGGVAANEAGPDVNPGLPGPLESGGEASSQPALDEDAFAGLFLDEEYWNDVPSPGA